MRLSTIALATSVPDKDLARFKNKVVLVDECWVWQSTINRGGYGQFYWARRMHLAHRISYGWFRGPIPEGHHIDHLCRNRRCVNPHHLEAVTQAENNRRAGAVASARTHCRRGHEYTPETMRPRVEGGRRCSVCMNGYRQAYLERQRSQ